MKRTNGIQRNALRRRNAAMKRQNVSRGVVALNASYDLAERSPELNEQFARARTESGRQALNAMDVRTMRDRSRYEIFQANPWLAGSSRSTTVSVVGRGAEIEVNIPDDEDWSGKIETMINDWLEDIKAPRKMRAMANAKQSDGAGMGVTFTNGNRPDDDVQLDFLPFDVDHIKSPFDWQTDGRGKSVDGKVKDRFGNVIGYWMTPEHPAENPSSLPVFVPAEFILDVWNWQRPSQDTGAPEYATSVKNGPLVRTFRRATIDAAATAAKHTGIMRTNVDRFDDGTTALDQLAAWVQVPTQYGTWTAVPAGWTIEQMRAEHPNSTHEGFMKSLASEHGRAVNQPGFITLGDASDANNSSLMGLRSEWEIEVGVQRQDWETECLDKLVRLYLQEAAALGKIPKQYADIRKVKHSWRWNKRRHADTQKEYTGRSVAITSGTRSRRQWQIDDGLNPSKEDQMAAQGFGVSEEVYRKALFFKQFGDAARMAEGLPTMVDVQLELAKKTAAQQQQKSGANNADDGGK